MPHQSRRLLTIRSVRRALSSAPLKQVAKPGATSGTVRRISGYYPVSMIRLYRRLRLLTYLVALVQLALPGVLGVVHAMSAAERRGSVAHIEESTRRDCPILHSDDCTVCRVLSA